MFYLYLYISFIDYKVKVLQNVIHTGYVIEDSYNGNNEKDSGVEIQILNNQKKDIHMASKWNYIQV